MGIVFTLWFTNINTRKNILMEDWKDIQLVVGLKVEEIHQEMVEHQENGKMLIGICHKTP
ncbi:hypothetical protein BWD121_006320 [Bartonella sp. WD12.1]|nr:hypothetical protein BWD121_006320 [Bartonella sp. WD12.1]